jgi:hypothetical protein
MSVSGPLLVLGLILSAVLPLHAQPTARCRFLCTPEFLVEPTITFTNVFGSPPIHLRYRTV